ncbi:MAG TPA: hypothetical protein EYP90_12600 [Chromatiaceae bacterium]|nr:hypothetical protein [Chromatiaceae bacterium]
MEKIERPEELPRIITQPYMPKKKREELAGEITRIQRLTKAGKEMVNEVRELIVYIIKPSFKGMWKEITWYVEGIYGERARKRLEGVMRRPRPER